MPCGYFSISLLSSAWLRIWRSAVGACDRGIPLDIGLATPAALTPDLGLDLYPELGAPNPAAPQPSPPTNRPIFCSRCLRPWMSSRFRTCDICRARTQHQPFQQNWWKCCPHCSASLLSKERALWCYLNGRRRVPRLPSYPEVF
jgi:hypothetical protein